MKDAASPEITRITLQVLAVGLLIGGVLWVLQPFIPSILWATIIVTTTWPLFVKLQSLLWNKRYLAVTAMIVALLLVIIVPCVLAVTSIVSSADGMMAWAKSLTGMTLPAPPAFVRSMPIVGAQLADSWQQTAALGPKELAQKVAPYAGLVVAWFASKAGSVGLVFLQFFLTVIIAALLYAKGEVAATTVRAFARRLAGSHGEDMAILAANAVRGVALGVVVTALVQAAVGGIGLAITGVASATVLTAVMFLLCLAQIGPSPVLAPAVIWVYWHDGAVWGTVLLVFAIVAIALDNIIRPILIRRGADLPLFLIFTGVIGGLVALGIIGLFIGPVILAVAHTLLKTWINGGPAAGAAASAKT